MDIVVHASLREGLARVLPQALIAGKPVVSYDVDGAARGRHVRRDRLPAAAQERRAKWPTRSSAWPPTRRSANRLGAEGRRRCIDRFDHQQMTRPIRELYVRLLG